MDDLAFLAAETEDAAVKTIMDGPSWRVVSDGTGVGTKVYAPDGSDVSETVRAVWLELGPHQPGRAPIFYGTLELLNVAVDVAVKGPLVRRFAYCKEHRELREVDEENRHLDVQVTVPGAAEAAAALQQNADALRAESDTHRCDGCREYLPCLAVTGRGWRCEGCR